MLNATSLKNNFTIVTLERTMIYHLASSFVPNWLGHSMFF